jgi:hypothetical protein
MFTNGQENFMKEISDVMTKKVCEMDLQGTSFKQQLVHSFRCHLQEAGSMY